MNITAKRPISAIFSLSMFPINLRVLWYQAISDSDGVPAYLQAYQDQLDEAVKPGRKEV